MRILFERNFMEALREDTICEDEELCRSNFRSDKLGNRVEVPYGGSYKVGKNGVGVGLKKAWEAKEDRTGQIIAIEPGHVMKMGSNGKGISICPSESTYEVNGQIMKRKKSTTRLNESPVITFEQLVEVARSFGETI